jgi:hypothetical protein
MYWVLTNCLAVTMMVNGKGIGLFPLVKSPTLIPTPRRVEKHFPREFSLEKSDVLSRTVTRKQDQKLCIAEMLMQVRNTAIFLRVFGYSSVQ